MTSPKVKNENVEGGTSPDESVQTLLRNLEFFALARELRVPVRRQNLLQSRVARSGTCFKIATTC